MDVTNSRGLMHALEAHGMTSTQLKVFASIANGRGRWVSRDTIVDDVWGDDPEGGPMDTANVIAVHICHLRHKLGFDIRNWHNVGYSYIGARS